MTMNHAQLRAFHAVASAGGFTRAAAALRVSQPTLSGQVKALENAYGVKLFERRGRGVAITSLGEALLAITRRQFALEAEAEQLLAAARGLRRGRLRLMADSPYIALPLMAAFGRRYPTIERSVEFGNTPAVLEAVLAGRCDAAVLPEVATDARLAARPVRRDRLVAFVERGHAWARRRSVRIEDLAGQPMVLREPGSTTRAIFERALADAGVAPGAVLEIGSREGVREAVAAGLGVGVVNEGEFGHDARLHKLALRGARVDCVESVVCLAARRDEPVVAAFLELAGEQPG